MVGQNTARTVLEQAQARDNFNIVLISTQPNTDIIGLKYLHAYLRKNGIVSRILILPEYNERMNVAVEEFFSKHSPTLVGMSALSEEFTAITKLTTFLKSKFNFLTFFGGLHATIAPEESAKFADFVIRGEAEDVLLEVCQRIKNEKDFSDISNIAFLKNGALIKNPMRQPEQNLDKYPFHEHLPPETYIFNSGSIMYMNESLFRKYSRFSGKFYSLTTARGCNLKCSFCIHSFFTKLYTEEKLTVPKIRSRSVDNCMKELKIVKATYPDLVYINIQDDNFFGHDIAWLEEFRDKYKTEINLPLCARAVPIFFTEEKARIMKAAGLTWVFMGLQTGSQRVQREIYERMITNEQFLQATQIIKKMGFVPYYDVILDSPFETESDVLETINVLLQIPKPFQLQMFSLAFFQGTRIYDIAKKEGMTMEDPLTKNFHAFRNTFLNKIVRMIPLLPTAFVSWLVNHRENKSVKKILPLVYYPSIAILEPITWIQLIYISLGGSATKTALMLKSFIHTGITNRILHKN